MTSAKDRAPYWLLTQFEDVRVPLNATRPGSSSPTWGVFATNGVGSEGVYAWLYNNVGTPSLAFACQLPHSYAEGTNLRPHLHLSPTTNDAGTIRMGLEYTIATQDAVFANTTLNPADIAAGGVAKKHLYLALPNIAGAGLKVSSILCGRVYRDNTVGGNYPQPLAVHEFDMHFEANALGSNEELIKET